ncbi:unnamed protein product [Cylindrotheca closterium]|uniref:HPP transmembrane region domain-containing protein n=1 Tax=Cylindrotheca closterium TaxID=2856 RepID=A0AAD2G7W9_9STRA|nr:unnamed protein product [Cylindrotheca closterium]CAJ1965507.1 unnamed protein product [Cylindrotheca closterium]
MSETNNEAQNHEMPMDDPMSLISENKDFVLEIDSDNEDDTSVLLDENEDRVYPPGADNQEEVYDMQFLHRVIEDAGRWAFGILLAELWVMDDTGTLLFRPDCGWWADRYASTEAFSKLTDSSLPDYIPADPCMPGIGLPGYLWSQATTNTRSSTIRQSTIRGGSNFLGTSRQHGGARRGSVASRGSMFGTGTIGSGMMHSHHPDQSSSAKLTWCEVKPLADDPDQPYCERTQYLANKAGLGLAAGVTFNVGGTRGIVVYMARDTASLKDLTDSTNEEYLQRATSVIGSAYSLRRARIEVVKKRRKDINKCWRRVRIKLLAIRFMGLSLAKVVEREEQKAALQKGKSQSMKDVMKELDGTVNKVAGYFKAKIKQEAKKFMGANVKAPPPMGWSASAFTFMGCFLTFAMLTNFSKFMQQSYGPEYSIVLPPFGALMGLHYGLTSAPASQPRNAIVGQVLGLTIAHLIGSYLDVELWLRQSLAIACAVGIMVKCSAIHPPAGAAAVVFSSGTFTWIQVGMMLVGNVLAILSSTLINNWNDQRQFPTFWGFRPINDYFSALFSAKKESMDKEK